MKKVVNMKKEENEMLRSQFAEMTDDYKKETDKLKRQNLKTKFEAETNKSIQVNSPKKQNGLNSCQNIPATNTNALNKSVKSTINVLIDLLEIFVSPRLNAVRQSLNTENVSASYSMDTYDSYNNDEERRSTMVEGIQGLFVAKLSRTKKNLLIDLDKDIDRVKAWNTKKQDNASNFNSLNISNLKGSKVNDSREDKEGNDFFDLSASNQFLIQSPKFNSLDYGGKAGLKLGRLGSFGHLDNLGVENENVNNYSLKKDEHNQLLNDSFLKDLKQNDSFSDDKNGSLIANSHFNNPFSKIADGENEIIDCSIIDLAIKPQETKMLFNDDPTEFNMELNVENVEDGNNPTNRDQINLSLNYLNTTFDEKSEDSVPVILQPIVNTSIR